MHFWSSSENRWRRSGLSTRDQRALEQLIRGFSAIQMMGAHRDRPELQRLQPAGEGASAMLPRFNSNQDSGEVEVEFLDVGTGEAAYKLTGDALVKLLERRINQEKCDAGPTVLKRPRDV